jgi:hypothetical protein
LVTFPVKVMTKALDARSWEATTKAVSANAVAGPSHPNTGTEMTDLEPGMGRRRSRVCEH